MLEINEVTRAIENYEKIVQKLFDQNIKDYKDEDRGIACGILNDTIDLIQDMDRDIYMFSLSFENYNNTYSFMPQYYFENAILHMDMIWERLLLIIGINYQIEFENIFERKSISSLFKDIKKNVNVDKDIKDLITEINGDYKIKFLKIIRNGDEHGLSSHLNDSSDKKINHEKLNETYDLSNGQLLVSFDKIAEMTNKRNQEEMKLIFDRIPDLKKVQLIYKKILEKCIIDMGNAFQNVEFKFKEKAHFIPNTQTFMISKNIYNECYRSLQYLNKSREDFRKVIDLVNTNIVLACQPKDVLRNNLFTDCLFRATEIERSIMILLDFYIDNEKDEKFKLYCHNEIVDTTYYFDHIVIKLYSVYEKLAKFLLCKYDCDQKYIDENSLKNMYVDNILDSFRERNLTNEIIEKFKNCIDSVEYNRYEEMRNKYYHCIREFYFLFPIYEKKEEFFLSNITLINTMMIELQKLFSIVIKEEATIYTALVKKISQKE